MNVETKEKVFMTMEFINISLVLIALIFKETDSAAFFLLWTIYFRIQRMGLD